MSYLQNMDSNGSREKGTPYNRNATLTQFKRTMEREGKLITKYTSGQEFKAFFRIKDDGENQKEVITMFYDITAPVRPGTLVMYGYGVFLTLNRETVENETYYKSTMVRCNGIYNDINGNGALNVPFYTENMKSTVSIGNQVISMLNGNIELITEENTISKKISINNIFNEFGRTFKVTNKYIIDGIIHLIAEVEADKVPTYNYSIVIDGVPESSVIVGDIISLNATPYINGSVTTGATFEWSSNNTEIATVDGVGNVTFLSTGNVSIICTWVEQNITHNTGVINVILSDVDPTPTEKWAMNISGNDILKWGYSRTYTITTTLDGVITHLDSIQYDIIPENNKLVFAINTFNEATGQIKLMVNDDSIFNDVIDSTFIIKAYQLEKGLVATIEVTIQDLM